MKCCLTSVRWLCMRAVVYVHLDMHNELNAARRLNECAVLLVGGGMCS